MLSSHSAHSSIGAIFCRLSLKALWMWWTINESHPLTQPACSCTCCISTLEEDVDLSWKISRSFGESVTHLWVTIWNSIDVALPLSEMLAVLPNDAVLKLLFCQKLSLKVLIPKITDGSLVFLGTSRKWGLPEWNTPVYVPFEKQKILS